ncbi:hypothetical protein HDU99_000891, partial [Rhizoclosmatium hyalinum]
MKREEKDLKDLKYSNVSKDEREPREWKESRGSESKPVRKESDTTIDFRMNPARQMNIQSSVSDNARVVDLTQNRDRKDVEGREQRSHIIDQIEAARSIAARITARAPVQDQNGFHGNAVEGAIARRLNESRSAQNADDTRSDSGNRAVSKPDSRGGDKREEFRRRDQIRDSKGQMVDRVNSRNSDNRITQRETERSTQISGSGGNLDGNYSNDTESRHKNDRVNVQGTRGNNDANTQSVNGNNVASGSNTRDNDSVRLRQNAAIIEDRDSRQDMANVVRAVAIDMSRIRSDRNVQDGSGEERNNVNKNKVDDRMGTKSSSVNQLPFKIHDGAVGGISLQHVTGSGKGIKGPPVPPPAPVIPTPVTFNSPVRKPLVAAVSEAVVVPPILQAQSPPKSTVVVPQGFKDPWGDRRAKRQSQLQQQQAIETRDSGSHGQNERLGDVKNQQTGLDSRNQSTRRYDSGTRSNIGNVSTVDNRKPNSRQPDVSTAPVLVQVKERDVKRSRLDDEEVSIVETKRVRVQTPTPIVPNPQTPVDGMEIDPPHAPNESFSKSTAVKPSLNPTIESQQHESRHNIPAVPPQQAIQNHQLQPSHYHPPPPPLLPISSSQPLFRPSLQNIPFPPPPLTHPIRPSAPPQRPLLPQEQIEYEAYLALFRSRVEKREPFPWPPQFCVTARMAPEPKPDVVIVERGGNGVDKRSERFDDVDQRHAIQRNDEVDYRERQQRQSPDSRPMSRNSQQRDSVDNMQQERVLQSEQPVGRRELNRGIVHRVESDH